jgi:hypothetical protein
MPTTLARPRALPVVVTLSLLFSLLATLAIVRPAAAQTELIADMTGASEVPGPGDEDGFGFTSVTVDPAAGEICVFMFVIDIAQASMAHIHEGATGVAGPIVVTLPTPDVDGFAEGCVSGLDATLLTAIETAPEAYYVNVHNAEFPDGALRGQLSLPPAMVFALLSGDVEVPGPGDPDGVGFAQLDIFLEAGRLCAGIDVFGIEPATAAHVHQGAEGVAGPVVVTLPTPPADGVLYECVEGLDPVLLQAILDDPAAYYVNIHTADYPDGAVRGQLSLEPPPPPPPPACEPGELCDGLLAPGTYTYPGFGTPLTFTTSSEWGFLSDPTPGWYLFSPNEPASMFTFAFVGEIFTDPCDLGSQGTIGKSPAELMAWLGDRTFLELSDPVAVTYGGASGLQVELTGVTVPPECTDIPVTFVFSLPFGNAWYFEEGSTARLVALDVNGQTIVTIAEHIAFDGVADPTAFLAAAQGVLDSFEWGTVVEPPPQSGGGGPRPTPPPLPDTALRVGG